METTPRHPSRWRIPESMLRANLAITCVAVQVALAAVLVVGEVSGRLRLPYSKFGTGVGVATPDAVKSAKMYVSFAWSSSDGTNVCAVNEILFPLAVPGPRMTFQPFFALFVSNIAMYALPVTGEAITGGSIGATPFVSNGGTKEMVAPPREP